MSDAAGDTFRENFAIDEETGAVDPLQDTFRENANQASAPTGSNPPQAKSRVGWIVAGSIGVLCIIAIAAGMSNNGGDNAQTSAVAVPRAPPTIPTGNDVRPSEDMTEEESSFLSSDDTGDDGSQGTSPFTPQVNVGDGAVLAVPEIIATSSPTPSPTVSSTNVPSTSFGPTKSPTISPSANPTGSPSVSPSKQPTLAPSKSPTASPSASPSKAPTDEPTNIPTESPSVSPSKTPTGKPIDFSGWNHSVFGLEPTTTPSKSPTDEPTKKPTSDPTKQPTNEPTPAPTRKPTPSPITDSPTIEPTSAETPEPFFFGDDFVTNEDLGIDVSVGLSVRVIAEEGRRVPYANGGESSRSYHSMTDAAGIIPRNPDNPLEDGYAYVVNSEEGDGDGGVYGIYFDKDGNVLEYKSLLRGTTDNCGGGLTPWNTWVSCEEYSDGQCWQVDPYGGGAKETKLGGSGGRYESVAVDNTNAMNPVFFTTEDDEAGAMRRFVANGNGWDALHSDGDESFLNILDRSNFEWTTDEDAARESAARFYRNSEGVQYHEGKLYFMAKKDYKMIVLDLDDMTYETETTGKKFYGEGSFGAQPDQNLFGPTRKYIYFTEDGGSSPGVYARFGNDGTFFTLFQAITGGVYDGDETVGIALSPDNKRFYAGIQMGIIFEFTRDDGLPFE